jgi:hypothetical protein
MMSELPIASAGRVPVALGLYFSYERAASRSTAPAVSTRNDALIDVGGSLKDKKTGLIDLPQCLTVEFFRNASEAQQNLVCRQGHGACQVVVRRV